jgi:ABC-type nitrate/sulfonate/bicarbonate transport system ATPase subunit
VAPAGAQRAALARRPKPLSLDEPFSALDAFTQARLQAHVLAFRKKTDPLPSCSSRTTSTRPSP